MLLLQARAAVARRMRLEIAATPAAISSLYSRRLGCPAGVTAGVNVGTRHAARGWHQLPALAGAGAPPGALQLALLAEPVYRTAHVVTTHSVAFEVSGLRQLGQAVAPSGTALRHDVRDDG